MRRAFLQGRQIEHSTNQPTAQGEQRKSERISGSRCYRGFDSFCRSRELQGLWQGRMTIPLQSG